MNSYMLCDLTKDEYMDITAGGFIDSVLRIGTGAVAAAGGCGLIYAAATATQGTVTIAGVAVAAGIVGTAGVLAVGAGAALIGYGVYSLLT